MYRITIILLIGVVQGCVTQADIDKLNEMYKIKYNVSSSGESQFDKSKHIRVSKMFCSNTVVFELYQDTAKHQRGVVLLKAGTNKITNIGNGKSLHIKIDDKTHSFKSHSLLTEHDNNHFFNYSVKKPFSHKSYVLPETLIRDIAASNEFLAKVDLLNNSYSEGKCSPITLQEYKNEFKHLGDIVNNVTQKNIDSANKDTAQNGFRKFIKLIDSTKW